MNKYVNSPDPNAKMLRRCRIGRPVFQVAEGIAHTVILLPNGTVYAYGDNTHGQCDVSDWRDVVSIATDQYQTVGLFSDGTVKMTGRTFPIFEYDTSNWVNITAIAASGNIYGLLPDGNWMKTGDDPDYNGLFGNDQCVAITGGRGASFLQADGTVQGQWYTERDDDISSWRNITKVAASRWHIVGLSADGRVQAICYEYRDDFEAPPNGLFNECAVQNWRNIKDIAVSNVHTVGLCADGTLKATGYNQDGQCDVGRLKNVKAFAVSDYHTVALLSNGTVVAAGSSSGSNRCNVRNWTNVAQVWAARDFTVARRHDGTFLCTDAEIKKRIDEATA